MFNSGILDVVIGLVVVYLQLSLVCTAINELIASWFRKRGKELKVGIGKLLSNDRLVEKFYAHPLVKGLRPDDQLPSYIPSRIFALTVMDIIRRHSFDGAVAQAALTVEVKKKAEDAAQYALEEAQTFVKSAEDVAQATNKKQASAPEGEQKAALEISYAENQLASAKTALKNAKDKLDASNIERNTAESDLARVKRDADLATDAESKALTAEAAAIAKPKDATLQKDAADKRKIANEAAYTLAPNATSLQADARDRVARAQDNVIPPELKAALLALMDNAGTNLNKAQTNLEHWFDNAMDRVSGVYKRKSQVSIVIIASLVTIFANVDSLQVADSLSRDKALRESLVAAAPELAKTSKDAVDRERGESQPNPTPASSPSPAGATVASTAGSPNPSPTATPSPTPAPIATPSPSIDNINASLNEIKKFGLPLGYINVCTMSEEKRLENNCPNEVDAKVMDAEAAVKRAQDDLDTATAKLQKANAAKLAVDAAQKAVDDAKKVPGQVPKSPAIPNNKVTVNAAEVANKNLADLEDALKIAKVTLKQTDVDRKVVEATKVLTSAQLAQAILARDQALKAAVEAKEVEAKAVTAEAEALRLRAEAMTTSPQDPDKERSAVKAESDAQAARRNADNQEEMLRVECPKCRKESELSASELKQRLPSFHGYHLTKEFVPAVKAFFLDCAALAYSHWLGWLLTAMAISLGAPFWFDTLNRLMVIRSTVKPHEKSKEQESKDNPDEPDQPKKN